MEFVLIGDSTYLFFLERGRNYVSIIIAIVTTNINVLVSHSAIMKSIRKFLQVPPPPPSPYQVFTRFVYCFTRNTLFAFFGSDQSIAKDNAFSKSNNFFSTHCWSVLILRFCLCVSYGLFFQFCHHETTNQ